MANDEFCRQALNELNDIDTEVYTHRKTVLKNLEGGCTAPIGALAVFVEDDIVFKGVFFHRWKTKNRS
jgi:hydroxymethylbilane synthase